MIKQLNSNFKFKYYLKMGKHYTQIPDRIKQLPSNIKNKKEKGFY
jgi:hypothetical protein